MIPTKARSTTRSEGCDELDFAAVYRDHVNAIYNTARVVVGPAAAHDVTQDVFLAYWQQPDRFDVTRGPLRAYLLTVARHRAIDVNRSERSRSARQQCSSSSRGVDVRGADWWTHERSDFETLNAGLSGLDPKVLEAVSMTYFGELTYRDAALALNEPEGTIKSRIRKGLSQLRDSLDGIEFQCVSGTASG